MKITTDNFTAMIFLVVLLLCIAVGGTRCAKIAKADELPPLYLEYHLPAIYNHPLAIGEPPEPVE